MASRTLSPGGSLLRASRIFSVPAPIPRPASDVSSFINFTSDTATLAHPTHLSIATPQTSLAKGDWGFKRPLPIRSTTKTSTPLIRVNSIDTYEHITEFGSSADHALTVKKFQQLDVPFTVPQKRNSESSTYFDARKSVFEGNLDTTTRVEDEQGRRLDDVRWKFKGPWLAGQNEGEFNEYIRKEVRRRKQDFRQFLRISCANVLTQDALKNITESDEQPRRLNAEDITEAQLSDYIKTLRKDRSKLYVQIRDFLDLPPAPAPKPDARHFESWLDSSYEESGTYVQEDAPPVSNSPYAETGPPKTHPSAGLYYARTDSHLYNHPEHGPQKSKSPVKARVLMPKQAPTGNFQPILGVAGFATDLPKGANIRNNSRNNSRVEVPGANLVDPVIEGGAKTYVSPVSATIDPSGKVNLTVELADMAAIAVKEGRPQTIPQPPVRPSFVRDALTARNDRETRRGIASGSGTGSYGLNL